MVGFGRLGLIVLLAVVFGRLLLVRCAWWFVVVTSLRFAVLLLAVRLQGILVVLDWRFLFVVHGLW